MRMRLLSILFMGILIGSIPSFSQTISGRVVDATNKEGIEFANVYWNTTSLGVSTGLNGNFTLRMPERPGVYELVVSFVGYQTYKSSVRVGTGDMVMGDIGLTPKEEELKSVEVTARRDIFWEKNYRKFKKVFLGNSDYAKECEILNPWELEFTSEKEGVLLAKANHPIQILNHALGYLVQFDLVRFRTQGQAYLIEGHTRFVDQTPHDSLEGTRWSTNREIIYRGSRQYLLRSIVQKRLHGEGFKLYGDKPGFENTSSRSAFFYQELGRFILPLDTTSLVRETKQKGVYSIRAKGNIEVHFTKAFARRRTYNDVPWLVGWVTIQDSLLVNEDGIELNPLQVNVSGYLNAERIANLLPLNYKTKLAVVDQTLSGREFESIHMHTDKPYYYPGEVIWFKGYVRSATPPDSLSKIAHVELLQQDGKSVEQKLLLIDSGSFVGSFHIPESTTPGVFFLRAYTQFNRNFGDESLYTRYVPILPIKTRVRDSGHLLMGGDSTGPLRIVSDKRTYGLRERVQINLPITGDSIASDLSVSVTDAFQVASVELEPTILSGFKIHSPTPLQMGGPVKFEKEQGISLSGIFQNKKRKNAGEILDIIRLNPPNYTSVTSKPDGQFIIHDGLLYDTIQYVIKTPLSSKGSIVLNSYPEPTFTHHKDLPRIDTVTATTVQRITKSIYADTSSNVLNTILVKGRRVRAGLNDNYKSTMGRPDYMLSAKEINTGYGNLLLAMQGRFPGLIIRNANIPGEPAQWQVFTTRGLSMANPREVLVTINDVPMLPPPGQVLSIINPDMVESIEVTNRINPLYGGTGDFTGAFGVVAIYTKTGYIGGPALDQIQKKESIIKIVGLSRPPVFVSPDYAAAKGADGQDARSTLYWNPRIKATSTQPGMFSFYTSDMPGDYRIVVEGVLSDGSPVRSVSFIHVD